MKKLIFTLLSAIIMFTAGAQTYNMEVSLKNGSKVTVAADSVVDVRFVKAEVEEFNILTEECIPDEIFRNYVKDVIAGGADEFTNVQAAQYDGEINIAYQAVTTARGVEFFTSLTSLDLSSTSIEDLNLKGLNNLRSLIVKDCRDLTSLDITGLNKLEVLDISSTKLRNYPLTDIPKSVKQLRLQSLSYMEFDLTQFPNLEVLDLNSNNLSTADFSSNTKLREVYLSYNNLTIANFTSCTQLREVSLDLNNLTSANFDNCENLLCVIVSFNPQLTDLSLQGCNKLNALFIHYTQLNGYDITPFAQTLKELNIGELTGFSTEVLSNIPNLTFLECQRCQLSGTLNMSDSPKLNYLRCEENPDLSSVILTNCNELKELHCYSNQNVESVELPENQSYIEIMNLFEIPKVTEMNLRNLSVLNRLQLSGTSIKRVDISECNHEAWLFLEDENPQLKEIKVWPTFDMANPPSNIKIPETAKFVYEFSE